MTKYKQIALKRETYNALQRLGGKNETYDEIVRRLINLWIENVGENLTRLKK